MKINLLWPDVDILVCTIQDKDFFVKAMDSEEQYSWRFARNIRYIALQPYDYRNSHADNVKKQLIFQENSPVRVPSIFLGTGTTAVGIPLDLHYIYIPLAQTPETAAN